MKRYDVVIVGGAAVGSAAAYFLAAEPRFDGTLLVLEQDFGYQRCATTLSVASIRHQFSTPENIRMSMFGTAFVRDVAARLAVDDALPDVGFHEGGYLFLASPGGLDTLRANHRIQRELGADVGLYDPRRAATALSLAAHRRSGRRRTRPFGRGLARRLQPDDGAAAQGRLARRGVSAGAGGARAVPRRARAGGGAGRWQPGRLRHAHQRCRHRRRGAGTQRRHRAAGAAAQALRVPGGQPGAHARLPAGHRPERRVLPPRRHGLAVRRGTA